MDPASSGSGLGATTPAHSHPLSIEQGSSKGRRSRQHQDLENSTSASNYFTLKAQLQTENKVINSASWDSSVRRYGKGNERRGHKTSNASLSSLWDRSPRPPLIVVGVSDDSLTIPPTPLHTRKSIYPHTESSQFPQDTTEQILAAKWYQYSDQVIEAAISKLETVDSLSDPIRYRCYAALRVLSSALHNLTRVCKELEEDRRILREKELARRRRAADLLQELRPSEQEIAKRVLQSLFPDDDEGTHQIQRRQSVMVGCLINVFSGRS
jgi:small G protein signaling modulator 3